MADLLPVACTANVEEDDDIVEVTGDDASTGDPVVLSDLNCRPNATVFLGGLGYLVKARVDTTHFQLERDYEGADATGISCSIAPFTPEMGNRAALSRQLLEYSARLDLLDHYGRTDIFYVALGSTGANDPGPGFVARNAVAWADATALYFDVLDAGGFPAAAFIDLWAAGTVVTLRDSATGAFASYTLAGAPTNEGPDAWRKLTGLTLLEVGGGGPADGADLVVEWNRKGATGATGAAGANGVITAGGAGATDNRLLRADGTGGATIQNSAITVDDSGNMSGVGTLAAGATTFTGLVDLSGASAGQIKFPATQNPSSNANTLDDYEEGTYTPSVAAFSGTLTGYTASGVYTKIGNRTLFNLVINITNTGSAAIRLDCSLPFIPTTLGAASGREVTSTGHGLSCSIHSSAPYLRIQRYDATYPGGTGYDLLVSGHFT